MVAQRKMVKSFQAMGEYKYGDSFDTDDWVASLTKALHSGQLVNPTLAGTADSGAALRLENLDATLTSVLIDRDDFVIFNFINRVLTTNNFYQWTRRRRYGSTRGMAGFPEGGTPVGTSAQFERNGAFVKFLGVRRGLTQQVAVMGERGGMMVDPVAEENRDGTMELLEKIERNIVWARKDILDETREEVNYDGIIRQMEQSSVASKNIIDLRNDYLNFTTFDEVAENLRTTGKLKNFRDVKAFLTPNSLKTLTELVRQNNRFAIPSSGADMTYDFGARVDVHRTQFGDIPFESSILLDAVDGGHPLDPAFGADDLSPASPATPTAANAPAAGGRVSLWDAATSTYYYISAFNSYGESLATYAGGATTVAVGDEVTITIPRVVGAIGYRVYRNDDSNDVTKAGYIGVVGQPVSGNATFYDENAWIPNTDIALILERDEADLALAQLSPLVKWPLAVTSTTIEFLLLLYHTLVVKAPERQHVIKNIKRLYQ